MIWKDIPGYEGLYRISNKGEVKSLKRKVNKWRGKRTVRERVLKQDTNIDGYKTVVLSKNCRTKRFRVHRLLLTVFDREQLPGEECRHLDGNRQNNNLVNLKWGTRKENHADAIKHGTHTCLLNKVKKGENNVN